MTCHWFRHHAGVSCIPVLTCQLHQGRQPGAPDRPVALGCCTKRSTTGLMVIGLRMEPELERQLDRLAQQQGKTRSICISRMPGWSPRP